jgi:hypothetical protein
VNARIAPTAQIKAISRSAAAAAHRSHRTKALEAVEVLRMSCPASMIRAHRHAAGRFAVRESRSSRVAACR